MTGPTATPRGEHTPAPGTTWNTQFISLGENDGLAPPWSSGRSKAAS